MYRTIVVEDEFDIRTAIINTIDWESKGFYVSGEASNGQEALELIQAVEPDLVITDIKMPFMDGIQLATAIRETNPIVKIVFLSGFNEFDYAISALKLNVIEYILKPISKNELSLALDKIREKLDAESRHTQDVVLLQERFDRDWTVLKNSFLIALIKGTPSDRQIAEKINKYQLRLQNNNYVLFTMRIDHFSLSASSLETDDIELMLLSLIDITYKLGQKYLGMEAFIYEENIVAILSDTEENILAYSDILNNEICQHIRKYCGFSVTIGVSRPFIKLSDAPKAYADSISAIHYRMITGGDRVIYISDLERIEDDDFTLTEAQIHAFSSLIKTGSQETLSGFLTELFQELRNSKASLKNFQICIVELFSLLIKASHNVSNDQVLHIGNNLSYLSDLYKQDTVDEIKSWFETLCYQVMEGIDLKRKDTSGVMAEQALHYMKSKFADSGLTLKSMSTALHISPNYLSVIIKKATGISFTNLLTNIRMEKAYDLLHTTTKNLQEIGEETGYADRHYFSYCFKKYFDCSPVQMRNRKRGEGQ